MLTKKEPFINHSLIANNVTSKCAARSKEFDGCDTNANVRCR